MTPDADVIAALAALADVPGIEPTNNAAERALRPAVLTSRRNWSCGKKRGFNLESVAVMNGVSWGAAAWGRSRYAENPTDTGLEPEREVKMRRSGIPILLIVSLLAAPAVANAEKIKATLIGYEEVPAVSTVASGAFSATISNDDQSIGYEVTYSGLQGTVTQSHIHVAQLSVIGSIVIWLCGTTTNPGPTGTPTCPQSGTVTGQITAANVVAGATASQQLGAGELAEVIAAIRAGAAYANVHSNLSPGGEIRGQIQASSK